MDLKLLARRTETFSGSDLKRTSHHRIVVDNVTDIFTQIFASLLPWMLSRSASRFRGGLRNLHRRRAAIALQRLLG